MKISVKVTIGFITYFAISSLAMANFNPFASTVLNQGPNEPNSPRYLPAPGQNVNNSDFNDPYKATGPVSGGGTNKANNGDIVTLGGFGGQIVLAFDHDVENNPANPMGLDAIVFTNAFWYSGHPQYHWAELATIEIMPELNGTSEPNDDPCEIWYPIPGSHLADSNSYCCQLWEKNIIGEFLYPNTINEPNYSTCAYELFPVYQYVPSAGYLLVNPFYVDEDPNNDQMEGYWGYAEYTPTLQLGDRDADDVNKGYGDCPNMPPELFYTVPDDPFTVGILPGTCGGDAFDIDWAVNPDTWQPANLDTFRYIRIRTAPDIRELGAWGEVSAEVDAVSDVRPLGDINGDNEVDYNDLGLFAQSWLSEWPNDNFNPAADFLVDNKINLLDYVYFAYGWGKNAEYKRD
jgi:hypothetical protein